MFQWLYSLFGTIIRFIYFNSGENFGVALIIFTVLMKIVLLPLGIKQQRSMMRTQSLQPQLNELQRKYANDKDKLSRETMELYKKNNVSPFGGCLPMILQLVIILVMVQIVYRPGTYIMGIENLGRDLTEQINAAKNAGMNFNFLWWNLADKPVFSFTPDAGTLLTWVLPLLATLATYFSGVISQKTTAAPNNNANTSATDQAQQMTKSMTTVMPLMTLFFTFTLPASASLYWFISSITQTAQQFFLSKVLKINVVDNNEGGSYHDKYNKKRKKR